MAGFNKLYFSLWFIVSELAVRDIYGPAEGLGRIERNGAAGFVPEL